MKMKKLVCMALPVVSMLFVACTPIDISKLGAGEQQADSTAEASLASEETSEAASEGDSAEADNAAEDGEFFFEVLEKNKKKEADIGNDGKMDTLLLEINEDGEGQFKVNDKVVEFKIPVEGDALYGDSSVIFVHRSDGDYFLHETEGGESDYGRVELYKWNDGSLELVDKVNEGQSRVQFDDKNGTKTYAITAKEVIIETRFDILGSWKCKKEFTYGDNGFDTLDWKHHPIEPLIEGADAGLELKKDVTFTDDSGEEPKTAKAGEKIYPCDIYQNCVGFNSESGEFLGYLICDYNETDYKQYIDGVCEDELFVNNLYVG